jgi:L-iditol 2-dehydrogenase
MTQKQPNPEQFPALPDTMRAAVLFGPRDMRVIDWPVPRPAAGEVLIKVAMCGTCGTDLKIYNGLFPLTIPYGQFIPGHEWTGTVVALGDSVDEFAVGDRVCIESHHGCGRCDNCLVGKYTACLNYGNAARGHRATGMTANGGFAEYVVHHVSALYPLPAGITFADAVLLTTAGSALYGLDKAGGYIVGQDVMVSGPGPIGLMTVQLCKQMGAAKVILTGTRDGRLEMGRELGADYTINVREQDAAVAILALTNGKGVDLSIECSGAAEAPQQCVDVTKRGGKILFVAFYNEPIRLDLNAVVRNDVNMYTSRGEGGHNVKRAIALATAGKLQGKSLVTHRFPLQDICQGLRVLQERIGEPLKVVFVP